MKNRKPIKKYLLLIPAVIVLVSCSGDSKGPSLSMPINPSIPSTPATPITPANIVGMASILGDAIEGETLLAEVTDANSIANAVFSYQWAADGADIPSATQNTLVLSAQEIGATITVTVNYTDDAGFAEQLTSAATAAVVAQNNVGSVVVTGLAKAGETLSAIVTDSDGTSTSSINYQWYSVSDVTSEVISNATNSTYTLTSNEVGTQVRAVVDYVDDRGFTDQLESALTEIVEPADTEPVVTGVIMTVFLT